MECWPGDTRCLLKRRSSLWNAGHDLEGHFKACRLDHQSILRDGDPSRRGGVSECVHINRKKKFRSGEIYEKLILWRMRKCQKRIFSDMKFLVTGEIFRELLLSIMDIFGDDANHSPQMRIFSGIERRRCKIKKTRKETHRIT